MGDCSVIGGSLVGLKTAFPVTPHHGVTLARNLRLSCRRRCRASLRSCCLAYWNRWRKRSRAYSYSSTSHWLSFRILRWSSSSTSTLAARVPLSCVNGTVRWRTGGMFARRGYCVLRWYSVRPKRPCFASCVWHFPIAWPSAGSHSWWRGYSSPPGWGRPAYGSVCCWPGCKDKSWTPLTNNPTSRHHCNSWQLGQGG